MDAAAAGVKVASARKVLKLQQLLEQAMLAAEDASSVSSTAHGQLAARLKAAEQGGVAHAVLEPAKKLLQKLAATEALCVLEAALKPCSSWSVTARMAAIRTALDNAEDALGLSITDLVEEQQLKQRARHQLEQQQQQCSKEAAEGPLSAASAGNAASDSSTALQRTDSAASSVAGDGLSMSSTATTGTQTSSKVAQRSPASSTAVDEVITAVQELAVQAWELLQQDQRLVEDTDRKRAEQERIRRELKEVRLVCTHISKGWQTQVSCWRCAGGADRLRFVGSNLVQQSAVSAALTPRRTVWYENSALLTQPAVSHVAGARVCRS